MNVTRFWWIRHAPVINPEGRVYGQRDIAADTSNAAAFSALGRRIPQGAVWVATQLRRTQATATAIHAAMPSGAGAPPRVAIEPDFVEQSFGDWQGRTYAEIGAYGQGALVDGHRFWLAPADRTPPGGESFVDVMGRVARAVERLAAEHVGRDIVVVAHGGTIRAALAQALSLAPEAALALTIDTLSLTRVDRIEGPGRGHDWRIGAINLPAE
ncbi:MAG TPA: histidine phosphatase family protein [Alphaproteobacteria bacterium]|jgi:broad specificity phosphatase PhoE|nr:histidine phosphatase family protein [Alphaproteobacteria bacterium]